MTSTTQKSVYKYSGELGLWMGLYLVLMSACLLLSVHLPAAVMLIFPLALGWPIVLYILLRRIWQQAPHYRTLSATWLAGIWICIFGSLICAAFSAAWIILLQPDFLHLYLRQCVEQMQLADISGPYADMAATLRDALDRNIVPSPMQWVLSMIWLTAFSGAILSLIVALCMTVRSRNIHRFP